MSFSYDPSFNPPAPTLTIDVFDRLNTSQRSVIMAKLDTAADISAVPLSVLHSLDVPPERDILVSGFEGHVTTFKTYVVGMELPNARFRRVEVVATSEAYALLGRDVLNLLNLNLNGPQLTLALL